MAAGISDAVATALLNCLFNNGAFELTYKLATTYVSLHTAEATGANECAGTAYAREAVNANGGASPTWNNAATSGSDKVVTNAAQVDFTTPGAADWGTLTHFAVWDAVTAGNMLFRGSLTASKTPGAGDDVYFPAGALSFEVTITDP